MSSTDSNNSNSSSKGNTTNDDNNDSWYGIIGAAAAVAAGIGLYMSLKADKGRNGSPAGTHLDAQKVRCDGAEKTNKVFESPCSFQTPHKRKIIDIVDTADKCERAVNKILDHCRTYNVVGLDCEWLEENKQQNIQLLQLVTHEGYCALFRLRQMETIPECLGDFLINKKYVKVGVGIHRDAVHLEREFGLKTKKIFDLNILAVLMSRSSGTLKCLTFYILNDHLRKKLKLSRSEWRAAELQTESMIYAANDAVAAIEIFKKLVAEYCEGGATISNRRNLQSVLQRLEPYFDKQFSKYYHGDLPLWI